MPAKHKNWVKKALEIGFDKVTIVDRESYRTIERSNPELHIVSIWKADDKWINEKQVLFDSWCVNKKQ